MRNYSIDTLKFLSAFFVVCIHTKPFRDMDGQMYDLLWGVIRIIASFAVPFFFTAMGYLFFRRIDKEQSIRYVTSYLRKCCKYLILTVGVYSIYHCLKLSFSPDKNALYAEFFTSIFDWTNLYYGIESAGMFHLWFLLVPFYVLPLVYVFRKRISFLTFIFLSFNLIGILLQGLKFDVQVRDALFYGGFYICLGGWLFKNEEEIREQVRKINMHYLLVSLVFFNVLQICESLLWNCRLSYSISTIFITLILFAIILKNSNIWKNSLVNKIGAASLGVYLIHPLIIDFVFLILHITGESEVSKSVLWQIFFTPFVFVISYMVYMLLQKSTRFVDIIVKTIRK